MAQRCNHCDRSGRFRLQLTFRQAPPPGWTPEVGPPRVGFTVDTEGLYCELHRTWLGLRELVTPEVKLQVDAWFVARALGKCAFGETEITWQRVNDPDDPEAKDTTLKQTVRM
jgi:hypothetical protein